MPTDSVSYGVPTLQISEPDPAGGTLTGLGSVTLAATEISTTVNRNSRRQPIPSGAVLKAWLTLMGYDPRGGYAITAATAAMSTAITTSAAGKGLLLRVASPPTQFADAVCAAIWLQVGSANPQLCDFAIINPKLDFSFRVNSLPFSQANYTTAADLAATNGTPLLGMNGVAKTGILKSKLSLPFETTGGVNFKHRKEKFTASPDSGLNYPVPTGQATDLSTKILNPVIQDTATVLGGDYESYIDTDTAGTPIDQMSHDIFTSQSTQTGNQAALVTFAPDAAGRVLRRLLLGQVATNSDDFEENYRKDGQTELQLTLTAASLDKLLRGMPTGLARIDSI